MFVHIDSVDTIALYKGETTAQSQHAKRGRESHPVVKEEGLHPFGQK